MPTVSGTVVFDINRNANLGGNVVALSNIPIVLQNTATHTRLIVLTNATGAYSFINVPPGTYRIVESYGLTGGVPSPGDFSTASIGPVVTAQTPPITAIPSPPIGATNVDCVTPNTIMITMVETAITGQNIFNGPVIYSPLDIVLDSCAVVFPSNLVTDAGSGTFGSFAAGIPANTGTPVNPYPGISPDFTYVVPNPSVYTPTDGEFTIQNTMNDAMSNVIGAWWRISDHTAGNETGRMMVVNEDDPGGIIFRTIVSVTPNTTYLFSTWILNLFRVAGFPGPQFAVRILDEEQNPLYEAALGAEIPVDLAMPEWKEIGSIVNSHENTQLIIEFFSLGEAAIGNDFAIDDIAFRQVSLPQFELVKEASQTTAKIGDIVTYTVSLHNVCQQPLTNVFFNDCLPAVLQFVPDSVFIDGVSYPFVNPLTGFSIPDIKGDSSIKISFDTQVVSVPPTNPAVNTASIQYAYTPIPDGIPEVYSLTSNEVPLFVQPLVTNADLMVQKKADRQVASIGDTVEFCVTVSNLSLSDAQDVFLLDPLPEGIGEMEYSIDNGCTWQVWNGIHAFGILAGCSKLTVLIRGTVIGRAGQAITNTVFITSTTPDPNLLNNRASARVHINRCAVPWCNWIGGPCRPGCCGKCSTCSRRC